MNYSVSDMLIRIKNAALAGHKEVKIPYSKMNYSLSEILVKRGFIERIGVDKKKDKKEILIKFKFMKRKPVLGDLKIVSRPGLRAYVSKKKIPRVLGGLGMAIISTSKGLMTAEEARIQGLGGELICEVW